MDATKIQARPDPILITASSTQTKSLETNESAIETQSDKDQDNTGNVSTETVQLSDTSLKLSTSSPVKSSDRAAPIENQDQAQQALSRLIADFQSNPAQAQGAQNKIFSATVKSLLG